jgi:hypothetical protein
MFYRIFYTQGNGYHCSCCRNDWQAHEDCKTQEEVVEWLSELEAAKIVRDKSDSDDREVDSIRLVCEEELMDQFAPDPVRVKKLVASRERRKKADERAKEQEHERLQRAELARLEAKFKDKKK